MANDGDSYAVSAVTLLDTVNQKRHLTFTEGSDNCFCSYFDGAIQSGETVEMWAYFPAVPEGSKPVETMTVTTPIAPPLLDIPVTESSDEVDTPNLSSPEILDLTAISESLGEDQTGRTEDDDEISILLSSDVLFETNSASLNPEAEEILEQVAQEIDDASDISVNVDGHADDTGDDEINDPLSLERAEAVESELSQLITRDNVSFEVEGHGSSDPIASNGTEEGRERNRRVSVTFEK
jgi:outer membrane protein OmpA-like peptidoglycan-associated protein